MLIKLENPFLLVKCIEIISELVSEVRIKFSENGMKITAIDPANVSMVSFKIPKSAFSQFDIESNEAIGVNLESLKQVLKRCGSKSSLIIEKKESQLKIQIQDKIKRNFILSLIEIEREDKEMPALEFSTIVEINSLDLISSIEDCAIVSDACSFIINNEKFIIESKGLNSAMSEFSGDEAKISAENCKSKYSLEYLKKFLKGAKLSEKTTLRFAQDHPLRMDIKTEGMELSFILAPRVETEE